MQLLLSYITWSFEKVVKEFSALINPYLQKEIIKSFKLSSPWIPIFCEACNDWFQHPWRKYSSKEQYLLLWGSFSDKRKVLNPWEIIEDKPILAVLKSRCAPDQNEGQNYPSHLPVAGHRIKSCYLFQVGFGFNFFTLFDDMVELFP